MEPKSSLIQESISYELSLLVLVYTLIIALTRTQMIWGWVSVELSIVTIWHNQEEWIGFANIVFEIFRQNKCPISFVFFIVFSSHGHNSIIRCPIFIGFETKCSIPADKMRRKQNRNWKCSTCDSFPSIMSHYKPIVTFSNVPAVGVHSLGRQEAFS